MRFLLATFAAGIWINLCEFLRNELFFKQQWLDKYESLGLTFPSAPINAAMWCVWGFLFAACLTLLGRKQAFLPVFAAAWTIAFPLMWIVIWNLNVLPLGLLPIAVPGSMVEVAGAVLVVQRICLPPKSEQFSISETAHAGK